MTSSAAESNAPAGVPAGSGLVSEEAIQKGFIWMNKIAKDMSLFERS